MVEDTTSCKSISKASLLLKFYQESSYETQVTLMLLNLALSEHSFPVVCHVEHSCDSLGMKTSDHVTVWVRD